MAKAADIGQRAAGGKECICFGTESNLRRPNAAPVDFSCAGLEKIAKTQEAEQLRIQGLFSSDSGQEYPARSDGQAGDQCAMEALQ